MPISLQAPESTGLIHEHGGRHPYRVIIPIGDISTSGKIELLRWISNLASYGIRIDRLETDEAYILLSTGSMRLMSEQREIISLAREKIKEAYPNIIYFTRYEPFIR